MVELPRPTDDSREILSATGQALQRIYRKGYLYQKGGVMLLDLIDAGRQQLSLLDTPQSDADRQRSEKLMGVMDELNRRMGAILSCLADLRPAPPGIYAAPTAQPATLPAGTSCRFSECDANH